jgi:hypothetical protein
LTTIKEDSLMRKLRFVMTLSMLVTVLSLAPLATAQDDGMMHGPNVIVTLTPPSYAEAAGLAAVTGWAHFNSDAASVHISLEPNGATLPEGTVLEGWVVDAGLDGGPGTTNASDADETYGTSFGDASFDAAVEAAPYALSTGVLTPTDEGTWEVDFEVPGYNFSPYDAVVITAESDGDSLMGFDPRPGAPVFAGAVADGTPADEMSGDDGMSGGDEMSGDNMSGDEMMMGSGTEVTLAVTPLAEGAGLAAATGSAVVFVEDGAVDITVNLNGAALPEGTVLEGWVVDAGLNGGPGTTNVTDADEAFGTPFDNANFDTLVESAPYALSTGVLHDNMDGTLTVSFHVPGYNFSPYDAVVITLESDGDTTDGFDPRPGTPVLAGEVMGMGDGM